MSKQSRLPPRDEVLKEIEKKVGEKLLLYAYRLRKWFPIRRGIKEVLTRQPPRYVRAVDTITFYIKQGETFCLVGESGCGKTTTGRTIIRLLEPTGGYVFYKARPETLKEVKELQRNVYVKDGFIDLTTVHAKRFKPLRKELQIIFQDPYGSLNPRFKIKDILEEPLIVHGLGGSMEEREKMILKALEDVKLTPPEEFAYRYPHMLSGGQRQRIGIARAVILNPRFIVADEPVSMLDVSIRAEILELMNELKRKYGLTYLFITHDLAVARYICDRIAVMYLGKIVEIASSDELIDNPLHPYTKALIAAVPEPDPELRHKFKEVPIKGEIPSAAAIPPGCRFHPRCVALDHHPELRKQCTTVEPDLIEYEKEHYVACWLYRRS